MIPGPDYIIACPYCASLSKSLGLMSMNTSGAVRWTDGKVEVSNLTYIREHSPEIARCWCCSRVFWTEDAEAIGQIPSFARKGTVSPAWENAPLLNSLSDEELLDALDEGLGSSPWREYQLRLLAWRALNDTFRNPSQPTKEFSISARQAANMESLIDFLDADNIHDLLIIAELERQLGRFDDALNTLGCIRFEWLVACKAEIQLQCHKQSRIVQAFSLQPYDSED